MEKDFRMSAELYNLVSSIRYWRMPEGTIGLTGKEIC